MNSSLESLESLGSLDSLDSVDFGNWHNVAVQLVDGIEATSAPIVNESFDGVSDMYSKLEGMMAAVRQEVSGLERMKTKLRDYSKLKEKLQLCKKRIKVLEDDNGHLKRKLDESDALINQFRIDMQRLNDLYSEERQKHTETQKNFLRQEQALAHAQGELNFIQNELKVNMEMKKTIKDLKAKLAKAQEVSDEEKSQLQKDVFVLEQHIKDSEKVKAELGAHVWNLTEEMKKIKTQVEKMDEERSVLEKQLVQAKENNSKGNESLQLQIKAEKDASEKLKLELESFQARNHALLSDMMELKRSLKEKDDKVGNLELSLVTMQDSAKKERISVNSKLEDLAAVLKSVNSQNMELEEKFKGAQQSHIEMEKAKGQLKKLLDQKSEAVEALELELVVTNDRY